MTSVDHPIRRKVLLLLTEHQEWTRSELAALLAADTDNPYTDSETLEIVLHHNHLPRLDSEGYIIYDSDSGDLILYKNRDVIRSQLDA